MAARNKSRNNIKGHSLNDGFDTYPHSDSEANVGFRSHEFGSAVVNFGGNRYARINSDIQTDGEDEGRQSGNSLDEFGEHHDIANRSNLVRTGRQRKKLAARSKGGEFRQRRKKRRLYFCCVSSEIDVQKLFDYLVGAVSLLNGWKYQLHADVLHLFKPSLEEAVSIPSGDADDLDLLRRHGSLDDEDLQKDLQQVFKPNYLSLVTSLVNIPNNEHMYYKYYIS